MMEPKKARLAITVTVIVAVLIVALCLFLLLGPTPSFGGGSNNKKPTTVSASEVVIQQPAAKEQPSDSHPDFAWFVWTNPNPNDLKGCAEEMQRPKLNSYLEYYEVMVVNPEFVDEEEDEEVEFAYLLYEPTKKLYSRHVILELPLGTHVLALAKENGYTLCLVQEGVGGWIRTDLLDYCTHEIE